MSLFPLPPIAADVYTPLLGVFYLLRLMQAGSAMRRALLIALLLNLAVAWGMMLADHTWDIWAAWSLDYSTHTAVALAFVICLSLGSPRQGGYWTASLVAYASLMIMLGYHSVADIVSTAVVDGILMVLPAAWIYRAFTKPRSPSGVR